MLISLLFKDYCIQVEETNKIGRLFNLTKKIILVISFTVNDRIVG